MHGLAWLPVANQGVLTFKFLLKDHTVREVQEGIIPSWWGVGRSPTNKSGLRPAPHQLALPSGYPLGAVTAPDPGKND